MRAGAYGLSLLSDPLDSGILTALEQGPRPLIELRQAVGSPPETTLRMHLKALAALGVVTRIQVQGFPGGVSYELTDSGEDLLRTLSAVSAWLAAAPTGPMEVGTTSAKSAIKAFTEAWTTKILRAIAARPLSLTELNRLLADVNYPALERRLAALRLAGQVAATSERNGTNPYTVTKWVRTAVRPLASAVNWEQHYARSASPPLSRTDIEAIFLLAVPLIQLPQELTGTCRLTVVVPRGERLGRAGAVVEIDKGRPVACSSDLTTEATSSVSAPPAAWLSLLSGRDQSSLTIAGDRGLGDAIAGGLLEALVCRRDARPSPEAALATD